MAKKKLTQTKLNEKARKYGAMFADVINESLPIYTDNHYTDIYEIQEGETFKQCYTRDKTAEYYECRRQISPMYFISNFGTLVSMCGGKASVVNARPRDKTYDETRYVVSIITYRKYDRHMTGVTMMLDPCVLVGLTYGADAESEARRIMKKYAMDSFVRARADKAHGAIEAHHKVPYHCGETYIETKKYISENSRVENIQFVCSKIHHSIISYVSNNVIMSIESETADTEKLLKADAKYIQNAREILKTHHMDDHTVMFLFEAEKEQDGSLNTTYRSIEEARITYKISVLPVNDAAKNATAEERESDKQWFTDNNMKAVCIEECKQNELYVFKAQSSNRQYVASIE